MKFEFWILNQFLNDWKSKTYLFVCILFLFCIFHFDFSFLNSFSFVSCNLYLSSFLILNSAFLIVIVLYYNQAAQGGFGYYFIYKKHNNAQSILIFSLIYVKIMVARCEYSLKEVSKRLITHKEFSAIVHNLGHVPDGKEKNILSVGIMEPGRHEFNIVMRDEIIKVTSGNLDINGTMFYPGGPDCIIKPGTKVVFESTTISSYLCVFPGETR